MKNGMGRIVKSLVVVVLAVALAFQAEAVLPAVFRGLSMAARGGKVIGGAGRKNGFTFRAAERLPRSSGSGSIRSAAKRGSTTVWTSRTPWGRIFTPLKAGS